MMRQHSERLFPRPDEIVDPRSSRGTVPCSWSRPEIGSGRRNISVDMSKA